MQFESTVVPNYRGLDLYWIQYQDLQISQFIDEYVHIIQPIEILEVLHIFIINIIYVVYFEFSNNRSLNLQARNIKS